MNIEDAIERGWENLLPAIKERDKKLEKFGLTKDCIDIDKEYFFEHVLKMDLWEYFKFCVCALDLEWLVGYKIHSINAQVNYGHMYDIAHVSHKHALSFFVAQHIYNLKREPPIYKNWSEDYCTLLEKLPLAIVKRLYLENNI